VGALGLGLSLLVGWADNWGRAHCHMRPHRSPWVAFKAVRRCWLCWHTVFGIAHVTAVAGSLVLAGHLLSHIHKATVVWLVDSVRVAHPATSPLVSQLLPCGDCNHCSLWVAQQACVCAVWHTRQSTQVGAVAGLPYNLVCFMARVYVVGSDHWQDTVVFSQDDCSSQGHRPAEWWGCWYGGAPYRQPTSESAAAL
jgi:hypothetical protein